MVAGRRVLYAVWPPEQQILELDVYNTKTRVTRLVVCFTDYALAEAWGAGGHLLAVPKVLPGPGWLVLDTLKIAF